MYERHFGISGLPFQLSPDPTFYFDSQQHQAAMAALRSAFLRETPFVVLSGAIGAGKTTVLRAWLAEAESSGIAVAQISNTQLDADDLLSGVAAAFGIDASVARVGGVTVLLRAFLRRLDGRAAVLVIDEAQNLDASSLQCLVDLAEVARKESARLRIVLAGQPELRAHVADAALHGLQAQVQHACHLEPLDTHYTRRYIEHRLLKVGWKGIPAFDAPAFDEIHALTGGVPRRINVLANRLLLGQFLDDTVRVDRRAVAAIAQALDAEIGDGIVTQNSPREAPERPAAPSARGAILCLASGRSDCIKAMALMHAADQRSDLAPTQAVALRDGTPWRLNHDLLAQLELAHRVVALAEDRALSIAETEARFERLVEQYRPSAVLVFDGDAWSHCCAMAAQRLGVPLVHIGADPQAAGEGDDPGSARLAVSRLADLRIDCQDDTAVLAQKKLCAGNLLIDAICLARDAATRGPRRPAQPAAAGTQVDARRGYGVVALKPPPADARVPCRPELLPLLREVSRDLPLVWPMHQGTMLLARSSRLARTLEGDRIARIEELGYASFLRLMHEATCVLTDSPDVMEEAAALGVPCLSLGVRHARGVAAGGWLRATDVGSSIKDATRAIWQILFAGAAHTALPALWDGQAGARIAEHLSRRLDAPATGLARRANLHRRFHASEAIGLNRST